MNRRSVAILLPFVVVVSMVLGFGTDTSFAQHPYDWHKAGNSIFIDLSLDHDIMTMDVRIKNEGNACW